ncbi:MAG: sensor domain-containing protein [Mycobacterium sp.]|jgi:hypothetical protein
MKTRAPAIAALLCLTVSGCATTTAGIATPAADAPLTTAETLPSLLLSASGIGSALSGTDMVVTRDVAEPWDDSARLTEGPGCLAVAGAAQRGVYADTGWTAMHGQVLREPPTAQWSHFATQAVVLFPNAAAAGEFFTRSRDSWAGCSNRDLGYPQPLGPEQLWSIGPVGLERDILSVSRVQRGPQSWSCQRALTVHGNVAVDVEACSLDGPTAAATAIAGAIADRLPTS